MKTTITEALQEIKTINNRLVKKRQSIFPYIARDLRVIDPLAKNTAGGSEAFIRQERQAIKDLEDRIIKIRTAIQSSNLISRLTVGTTTRKVAEWLTWRHEISEHSKAFVVGLTNGIVSFRSELQKKGGRAVFANAIQVNESMGNDPPQMVINIDEKALLAEQEDIETVLGELDGKLSLFNATTTIEV